MDLRKDEPVRKWASRNGQKMAAFFNSCDIQGHIFSSVKPSEVTNQDSAKLKIGHINGGPWEVTKSSVI